MNDIHGLPVDIIRYQCRILHQTARAHLQWTRVDKGRLECGGVDETRKQQLAAAEKARSDFIESKTSVGQVVALNIKQSSRLT